MARAQVEDFEVVFDGSILFVVGLCDLDKVPYGAFDVRDRLKKVFEPVGKIKMYPPCLAPVRIVFITQSDSKEMTDKKLTIPVPKPEQSKALLRELYRKVWRDLSDFFAGCFLAYRIGEEGLEIQRSEYPLLENLRSILETDWKQMLKKSKLMSQSKKEMAKLLILLSCYNSIKGDLISLSRDINTSLTRSDSFSVMLIKEIDLGYLEPFRALDVSSIIRNIEHVRDEIKTYSLSASTLASALIGGVVGSIITYFLSLL